LGTSTRRICVVSRCTNIAVTTDIKCQACADKEKPALLNISKFEPSPRRLALPVDVYKTLSTPGGTTLGAVKDTITKLQQIVDKTPEPQPTYSINGLSRTDLVALDTALVMLFGRYSYDTESILKRLEAELKKALL
jgi:hypothetical protein